MFPVALRPLLVLIAVLGALTAPEAAGSRADVDVRQAASMASPRGDYRSDQDGTWPLAVLNEPSPVSVAGTEEPGGGSCAADEGLDGLPQPKREDRALDPRRRGALAPFERPAALAFLRKNGSADAGGAGT